MAFKARTPTTFVPTLSNYNDFTDWRADFDNYTAVTDYFNDTVALEVRRARLFNIAGPEFAKFVRESTTVTDESSVTQILDKVAEALKPKRLDLQNREKLFSHTQSSTSTAAKYLEELRSLYHQANYAETIQKNILLRDLFISGIASREAKCLLYQQDSDSLTLDQCVHLVSSYETSYSGKRSSSPAQIDINTMEQNDKPWSCHSCETSSNPKETSVLDVNSVDHKENP